VNPKAKGSNKRLWYAVLYLLVLFVIGLAPILSVMTASVIANWAGCELHEGFANPCIIGGTEYGELLYSMAVVGWFALITLPLAALSFIALIIVLAVIMFRRLRSRQSA
jgi:uncharacterized membrane protein YhaH (DUF805 family)